MQMPFDAMTDLSDDALLALYGNGDSMAAASLTARLTPLVFRLAKRLLSDAAEAEDVTQEAMLRLWKIAPEWRQGEAKVSTWLYRVTTNLCTDRLRKRRGVALDAIAEPMDDTPGIEARMISDNRAEALNGALAKLPDRQREAVVLRHIEGLANPEIAEVLDISVEAVESLIARGKRGLAVMLLGRKQELGLDG
ncbi:MAG TPA: RNA polymerase sigma factor [Rhodobacteraceae bacterium]|jgi:RNA polymerase sigma factor (sigma-70 family)|nr:RNA polymerase sigma factor [Paracoccaceae bacterium]